MRPLCTLNPHTFDRLLQEAAEHEGSDRWIVVHAESLDPVRVSAKADALRAGEVRVLDSKGQAFRIAEQLNGRHTAAGAGFIPLSAGVWAAARCDRLWGQVAAPRTETTEALAA